MSVTSGELSVTQHPDLTPSGCCRDESIHLIALHATLGQGCGSEQGIAAGNLLGSDRPRQEMVDERSCEHCGLPD